MDELVDFGTIVLLLSGGLMLALLASKTSERFPIPEPALFLVLAAVASDIFPELSERVTILEVERIAVVALIVILFNGGTLVGWRRFRVAAVPIFSLGVFGTFATAGIVALSAHYVLDFEWITAGLLGAALAPTDPAVMFSVLAGKEIRGRAGTILEGESGVNDPVGIALMIGMIELAENADATFWVVVEEFAVEMSVGLLIGLLGAAAMRPLLRVSLPNPGLYPIRTLAAAGIVYGVASVAHGSGFLAVFVAGIALGDADVPLRDEIERFHTSLASLAEVVVFVALGITVDVTNVLTSTRFLEGLVIAVILALVARPLAVGPLLAPIRMPRNEKLFVIWSGLRGAVPILLAAFALLAEVDESERVYEIVFVVVAFSVIVQGSSIPMVARRLRIRTRQPGAGYERS
ncbi:MAG TPA: cation:proton antiporter [Gaiellaceae bacterium]|nr:cation:proton antiporter [Gaiellaceae bacterium]